MNLAFVVNKTIHMLSWFKEGMAEFIHSGDERLEYYVSDSVGGVDATKLNNMVSRATDLLNGDAWNSDSRDYAAGYLIVKYLDSKVKSTGNMTKSFMQSIQTRFS
ncbi:hypothetical protein [Metabacillus fastidiosus]|uniref:hypothetical protein n=1 Tax=Metabacillus fastidiosus TaxID=1458 RepID=UPI002DB93052|nr:hypothetical protein [Metabacillus fastidiosus]